VYDIVEDQQDKTMLLTTYHLAARRGEIFRIKRSDIDFKNGKIRLWTRKRKGGDLEFDWMPMTKELKSILLSWWEVRISHTTIDKEHVFVCLDQTPFCDQYYGRPFTVRQHFMERICEKVLKKRKMAAVKKGELVLEDLKAVEKFDNQFGIKPFGFHAIRHLAATVQYHNGKNLNWLQRFLRHKNATTTEKYLRKLGLDPLRKGLDEGFKRTGEVVKFPKEKTSGRISSRG
jgi:integrase